MKAKKQPGRESPEFAEMFPAGLKYLDGGPQKLVGGVRREAEVLEVKRIHDGRTCARCGQRLQACGA